VGGRVHAQPRRAELPRPTAWWRIQLPLDVQPAVARGPARQRGVPNAMTLDFPWLRRLRDRTGGAPQGRGLLIALAAIGCAIAACGSSGQTKSSSGITANGKFTGALAFARCMRSRGVRNFPDPKVTGNSIEILGSSSGINTQSPGFQSAQTSCKHLLPGGGPGSGPPSPQTHAQLLQLLGAKLVTWPARLQTASSSSATPMADRSARPAPVATLVSRRRQPLSRNARQGDALRRLLGARLSHPGTLTPAARCPLLVRCGYFATAGREATPACKGARFSPG
jgi:hypothetical protein